MKILKHIALIVFLLATAGFAEEVGRRPKLPEMSGKVEIEVRDGEKGVRRRPRRESP